MMLCRSFQTISELIEQMIQQNENIYKLHATHEWFSYEQYCALFNENNVSSIL